MRSIHLCVDGLPLVLFLKILGLMFLLHLIIRFLLQVLKEAVLDGLHLRIDPVPVADSRGELVSVCAWGNQLVQLPLEQVVQHEVHMLLNLLVKFYGREMLVNGNPVETDDFQLLDLQHKLELSGLPQ